MKTYQRTGYHGIDLRIQTNVLKSKGEKPGKCEFFTEMWVGLQISEEKIFIFGKKLVGPENDEEKKRNLWKKIVGGYRITAGTNFRHTFRKYLPDPPCLKEKIRELQGGK